MFLGDYGRTREPLPNINTPIRWVLSSARNSLLLRAAQCVRQGQDAKQLVRLGTSDQTFTLFARCRVVRETVFGRSRLNEKPWNRFLR